MSGSSGNDVMIAVPAADAVQQAQLHLLGGIRDSMQAMRDELIAHGELLRDTRDRVIKAEGENVAQQVQQLRKDICSRCDKADTLIAKFDNDHSESEKEIYGRLITLEKDAARDRGFWRPILIGGSAFVAAVFSALATFFLHR